MKKTILICDYCVVPIPATERLQVRGLTTGKTTLDLCAEHLAQVQQALAPPNGTGPKAQEPVQGAGPGVPSAPARALRLAVDDLPDSATVRSAAALWKVSTRCALTHLNRAVKRGWMTRQGTGPQVRTYTKTNGRGPRERTLLAVRELTKPVTAAEAAQRWKITDVAARTRLEHGVQAKLLTRARAERGQAFRYAPV